MTYVWCRTILLVQKVRYFFCFRGNAISSFYIKRLTAMFCNEFYAIASFILFSVENKIYFAFFKLEWVSCESNILEDFYNDLDDETFLGHEFGAEWEDESNISCSSSYTDVDLSDKILTVLQPQLMKKIWYQGNKRLKILMMSWTWIITMFYHPKILITYYYYSDTKGKFVMEWMDHNKTRYFC